MVAGFGLASGPSAASAPETAIHLYPRSGTYDHGAQIADLANTWAGQKAVYLHPGSGTDYYYIATTPRIRASKARIICAPGVRVLSALTARGSPSPPYNVTLLSIDEQAAPLSTSALAATVAPGQTWGVLSGLLDGDGHALAVGDRLVLQADGDPHAVATYDVAGGLTYSANIAGAGPFTGTLVFTPASGSPFTVTLSATVWTAVDAAINAASGNGGRIVAHVDGVTTGKMSIASSAPFQIAAGTGTALNDLGLVAGLCVAFDRATLYDTGGGFNSGSYVAKILPVDGVSFEGNGLVVLSGSTGERVISGNGCKGFQASGVTVADASGFTEYPFSGDQGARDVEFRNIVVFNGNTNAICLEAVASGLISGCRVENPDVSLPGSSLAENAAFYLQGLSRNILIENCVAIGRVGASGAGLAMEYDPRNVTVSGCVFSNCYNAIRITKAARLTFSGTEARNSVSDNVLVQSGADGDITYVGGAIVGAGGYGVSVDTALANKSINTLYSGNTSGNTHLVNSGAWAVG